MLCRLTGRNMMSVERLSGNYCRRGLLRWYTDGTLSRKRNWLRSYERKKNIISKEDQNERIKFEYEL